MSTWYILSDKYTTNFQIFFKLHIEFLLDHFHVIKQNIYEQFYKTFKNFKISGKFLPDIHAILHKLLGNKKAKEMLISAAHSYFGKQEKYAYIYALHIWIFVMLQNWLSCRTSAKLKISKYMVVCANTHSSVKGVVVTHKLLTLHRQW